MITIGRPFVKLLATTVSLLFVFATGVNAQPATAQPSELPDPEHVEILGRGPIHESFAETITFDPKGGIVVAQRPPEPIREVPPEDRPEGDEVTWIPGYWTWDDERNEFIWVSGVWRRIPPGRRWVGGQWTEVAGGFQWYSGYWADAQQQTIEPLPIPPQSVEQGPSSPPPSDAYMWVPGCWQWIPATNSYVWQPGYWQVVVKDWVWVPSYYCLTQGGAIFVSGYRDYEFVDRGWLYAPIRYISPVYFDPAYVYCPAYQLHIDLVATCLFIRPSSCHYYYGDYFAPAYQRRGYWPSYRYTSLYRGYDPIVGYSDWRGARSQRAWSSQVIREFERMFTNASARPSRIATPALLASSSSLAAQSSSAGGLLVRPAGRGRRASWGADIQSLWQGRGGNQGISLETGRNVVKDRAKAARKSFSVRDEREAATLTVPPAVRNRDLKIRELSGRLENQSDRTRQQNRREFQSLPRQTRRVEAFVPQESGRRFQSVPPRSRVQRLERSQIAAERLPSGQLSNRQGSTVRQFQLVPPQNRVQRSEGSQISGKRLPTGQSLVPRGSGERNFQSFRSQGQTIQRSQGSQSFRARLSSEGRARLSSEGRGGLSSEGRARLSSEGRGGLSSEGRGGLSSEGRGGQNRQSRSDRPDSEKGRGQE